MPVYEYECSSCKKIFELQQRMSDEPLKDCPECGGEVAKLISMSSFQLKGGGWYADGYGAKGCGKDAKSKDSGKESAAPACPAGGCCKGCEAAA